MVISHRFSFHAACPACGASDVIGVLEDAGPPFTDIPRRVYHAEAQKFVVDQGPPPSIGCLACGERFPSRF